MLLAKIVDGRFTVWGSKYERLGEPIELFESSMDEEVDRRIDKWRKHREKKLFGQKKPPDVFLPELSARYMGRPSSVKTCEGLRRVRTFNGALQAGGDAGSTHCD